MKRLSDVFEDEVKRLTETYGDEATALSIIEAYPSLVRFYISTESRWPVVSGRETFDWPDEKKPSQAYLKSLLYSNANYHFDVSSVAGVQRSVFR